MSKYTNSFRAYTKLNLYQHSYATKLLSLTNFSSQAWDWAMYGLEGERNT